MPGRTSRDGRSESICIYLVRRVVVRLGVSPLSVVTTTFGGGEGEVGGGWGEVGAVGRRRRGGGWVGGGEGGCGVGGGGALLRGGGWGGGGERSCASRTPTALLCACGGWHALTGGVGIGRVGFRWRGAGSRVALRAAGVLQLGLVERRPRGGSQLRRAGLDWRRGRQRWGCRRRLGQEAHWQHLACQVGLREG